MIGKIVVDSQFTTDILLAFYWEVIVMSVNN